VGPRAGLGDVEKIQFLTLSGLALLPLGRPAHSSRHIDYAIPVPYVEQLLNEFNYMLFLWLRSQYRSTQLLRKRMKMLSALTRNIFVTVIWILVATTLL
jgi:hypothetical protein